MRFAGQRNNPNHKITPLASFDRAQDEIEGAKYEFVGEEKSKLS
jgi:hypothetical protein